MGIINNCLVEKRRGIIFWHNYKNIIIAFFAIGLFSFITAFIVTDYFYYSDNRFIDHGQVGSYEHQLQQESELSILIQKYHVSCGHFIEKDKNTINADEMLKLEERYPTEEGWIMNEQEGEITFSLPVDKLCPADSEKRHLQFLDNRVAVFKGPAGLNGSLLFITSIEKEALPEEWQEKISNKEVNFETEKELLHALDTLDEYT